MKAIRPRPVQFLPYGRQRIDDADVSAVIAALQSDWLTQGPAVPAFEHSVANFIGAQHVCACSSGTAALHLAMLTLGIKSGDIVVTSPISFAASANCVRYVGAEVLFADIDAGTGLMSIESLQRLFANDTQRKIRAVIPVHLAGQPVDLKQMYQMAKAHGAFVVDDACHALGATLSDNGKELFIGGNQYSDISVFSFHPVKHVATGEGGALAMYDETLMRRASMLRTHGIERESFVNTQEAKDASGAINPWYYEMKELGFNYRMTDLQAALGSSQMQKLPRSLATRRQLAVQYQKLLAEYFPDSRVKPLRSNNCGTNAWHLFIVQIDFEKQHISRADVMSSLKAEGIGTQVHYIPIPMQPYYQKLGFAAEQYPQALAFYRQALSLPMYPDLTFEDIERVVETLHSVLSR